MKKFKSIISIAAGICILSSLTSAVFASDDRFGIYESSPLTLKIGSSLQNVPNSGFKVDAVNSSGVICETFTTDDNGEVNFSQKIIPEGKYTFVVTKAGYLKREISNVNISHNSIYTHISASGSPIKILAGDINGDDVINMIDVMAIGASFNTSKGDAKYNPTADLNNDGSINMVDVMAVAANFNNTTSSYSSNEITFKFYRPL